MFLKASLGDSGKKIHQNLRHGLGEQCYQWGSAKITPELIINVEFPQDLQYVFIGIDCCTKRSLKCF
jgi:hypothetical protein